MPPKRAQQPQATAPPIPEQMQQFAAMAAAQGISPEQLQAILRAKAEQARARQQQQQQPDTPQTPETPQSPPHHEHGPNCQHGHNHGQEVSIQQPNAASVEALALAAWLRSQDLKTRTCILNGQRKDLFKVKRAMRALQSPAYEKASARNKTLPTVTDLASAVEAFRMLPLSVLALRVSKIEPEEKPKKRIKGLWTVQIERNQEIRDELHYVWLYEGRQIKQKLYALGALVLIFGVVLFPLWPYSLRLGVYYLSVGVAGLIGLFFAMAIFRLILFGITFFLLPPGFWLYPNLFEDVGFFDSFRPLWGWHEDPKQKKKMKKIGSKQGTGDSQVTQAEAADQSDLISDMLTEATGRDTGAALTGSAHPRNVQARVEEDEDD